MSVLDISYKVEQKIIHAHQVDAYELRQHIVGVSGLRYEEDICPTRGLRYYVYCSIRGRSLLVVLYPSPTDAEKFALGSAYEV